MPQLRKIPQVSIIIPVFNRISLTQKCMHAIEANTPHDLIEVIIVDNASTDGTTEWLTTQQWPFEVKLIANPENLGYSKANNQGARIARGTYILLLNNDTEVQNGWLSALLSVFSEHPKAGVVGAKLLFPDYTIQHAGVITLQDDKQGIPLIPVHANYKKPDGPEFENLRRFPVVTGACMMVIKSLYLKLGGLDESYWNGYEDVDFCFQILEEGYEIYCEARSVVIHHESQSGTQRWVRVNENQERLERRWNHKITCQFLVKNSGEFVTNNGVTFIVFGKPTVKNTLVHNLQELLSAIRSQDDVIWLADETTSNDLGGEPTSFCDNRKLKIISIDSGSTTSEALNQCLKTVINPYVMLCNPDIEVTKEWIEHICLYLNEHKVAGVHYKATAAVPLSYYLLKKKLLLLVGGFDNFETVNEIQRYLTNKIYTAGYDIRNIPSNGQNNGPMRREKGYDNHKDTEIEDDMETSCMEHVKKSLEAYVEILHKDPKNIEALVSCGRISLDLGQINDAEFFASTAIESSPIDEAAHQLKENIKQYERSTVDCLNREQYLLKAARKASSGDYKGSLNALNELIEMFPEDSTAYNDIGVIHYSLGNMDEAQRSYEKANQISPDNETALKNLADFYLMEKGWVEKALKLYLQLMKNNPSDLECLLAIGSICIGLNRKEDAHFFYENVLDIDPNNETALQAVQQLEPYENWDKNETSEMEKKAPDRKMYEISASNESGQGMDGYNLASSRIQLGSSSSLNVEKKTKLKILMACRSFENLTGSEISTFETAKGLVEHGCDVSVVSNVGLEFAVKAKEHGIITYSLSEPPGYKLGDGNWKVLGSKTNNPTEGGVLYKVFDPNYDIIQVNHYPVAEYLLQLYPTSRFVNIVRSEIIDLERPVLDDRIKKYIAIRPSIIHHLISEYKIPKTKIELIYNPVDQEQFGVSRSSTQNRNGKGVTLFAGTMNDIRQPAVVHCIEKCKRENKELWLVGKDIDGYAQSYANDIAHVRYFPETANIETFFCQCDETAGIFLGRTTIEGFFCQKPGIVYHVDNHGKVLDVEYVPVPKDMSVFEKDNIISKYINLYTSLM